MSRILDVEHEHWVSDAVVRFEGPLTLYASRLLHDAESARDVVQETFLKLCASERSSIEGHLAEWLFTVCRNRALDVLRKEQRMSQLREEQVLRCLSPGPAPLEAAERQELGERVLELLETLARQSARSHPAQVPERVLVPGNQPHQRPQRLKRRRLDPRRDQDAAGLPVRRPGGQGSLLRRTRHDL